MLQFMSRDVGKNVADNSAGVSHRGKRPLLLLYLSIGLMGYALLLLGVFSRPVLVDASSSLEGIERSSSWHRQEPSMSRGSPPVLKAMPCVMMEQQSFPVVKNTRELLIGDSLWFDKKCDVIFKFYQNRIVPAVVTVSTALLIGAVIKKRTHGAVRYGIYIIVSALIVDTRASSPASEVGSITREFYLTMITFTIVDVLAIKLVLPYFIPGAPNGARSKKRKKQLRSKKEDMSNQVGRGQRSKKALRSSDEQLASDSVGQSQDDARSDIIYENTSVLPNVPLKIKFNQVGRGQRSKKALRSSDEQLASDSVGQSQDDARSDIIYENTSVLPNVPLKIKLSEMPEIANEYSASVSIAFFSHGRPTGERKMSDSCRRFVEEFVRDIFRKHILLTQQGLNLAIDSEAQSEAASFFHSETLKKIMPHLPLVRLYVPHNFPKDQRILGLAVPVPLSFTECDLLKLEVLSPDNNSLLPTPLLGADDAGDLEALKGEAMKLRLFWIPQPP
eukprot:GHVQ01001254.1.p1 GENE.GHVQ01001254.1~~GHVQ01001254.1.p1  ORF type:complete len:503 (+),score=55.84 GHVQ01001254.1:271-1779(+)